MMRFLGRVSLWILLATPLAASTVRIYVSNENSGTVAVIDPVTDKVVQTIADMYSPDEVVFSPDGTRAYIPDQDERVLNVVDTKTGKSIKKIRLSGLPNNPVVSKDGRRVLVAITSLVGTVGAIDIVDTVSLQRVKSLPMKGAIHDMLTTADGKYAIAGSVVGKFMIAIDLQTEEPAWEIPLEDKDGPLTFAIESGPDGSTTRIFTELGSLNGFAVVDFAKRKEVARIELPVAPFGYRQHPTHGTGISPDGKTLWVCSRGSNNVFAYSLPDLKLLGKVSMPEMDVPGPFGKGADPHWVAFTPDSKKVYIPLVTLKSVAVIDAKTMKRVALIPVEDDPRHVAMAVLPYSPVPVSAPPGSETSKWISQLPDADAKGIILAKCQLCHSVARIIISHRTKDEWGDLVDNMISRGAPMTSDDAALVVDYLGKNFGLRGSNPSSVTSGAAQIRNQGASPE